MDQKELGLLQKYEVTKYSNPRKKMDCLVLEWDDSNSWPAIRAYAKQVRSAGYHKLADDLEKRLARIEP